METHSEKTWSLLTDKPLLFYVTKYDEYVVLWKGVVMSREDALVYVMAHWAGIGATPKMKMSLLKKYLKNCQSGLYELFTDNTGYATLTNQQSSPSNFRELDGFRNFIVLGELRETLLKLKEKHSLKEALNWLNTSNASFKHD